MPGGGEEEVLERGEPRVWEGIPSIPGGGGRSAWSHDGQAAERPAPDPVGVGGRLGALIWTSGASAHQPPGMLSFL